MYIYDCDRWDLIKAMNWLEDPRKVESVLRMDEELFQTYKYALFKNGKIKIIKRG